MSTEPTLDTLLGFRRWGMPNSDGLLQSVTRYFVWPPGDVTAECMCRGGRRRTPHPHPVAPVRNRFALGWADWDNECGLYAWADPGRLAPFAYGYVLGAVWLWGVTAEHAGGWRAQHGRVAALVDPDRRVSPAYRVPRYPDLPTLLAEWGPTIPSEPTDSPMVRTHGMRHVRL